jgi:prepilin-type N-terminal cleavage/methylation domain-containing protein
MLNMLYRNSDRGFSLIEMLVVVILVGIVTAISVPSFLGLLSRYQVDKALSLLEGSIKETQRQAIRQGKLCRININTTTKKITGNPTDCLLETRQINNDLNIRTNLSGATPNISFSHKGSTTRSGTIVVSSNYTDRQKCFVISLGIGITRTGNYTGSKTGSVSATKCKSNN